ncbi:protein rep (plasmid) [Bacillus badius]|uniref:protein rep n=1 Tax=Bacillus badius TaxID=1455 RepID=UPI001CBE34D1|nr:protein rep [Bacillus badius]UAT33110.1 protein rep [Bacillus badius]
MRKKQERSGISPVDDEILGKYAPKKSLNRKAFHFIKKYLGEAAAEYFEECNTFISFLTNGDKSVKRTYKANNCKNRFCPMCAWKKAKKDAMKLGVMLEAIKQKEDKEFLFLTLTAPNCQAEELSDTIDKFNKAYHKLFKRRNVQKAVKGYVRKLEVTTDQELKITRELYHQKREYFDKRGLKMGHDNPQYDTYNPHFHAILVVNKSYFKKNYIRHDEWLNMWRDCMDDPSITQVRVERLKKKGSSNGVLEIAKYAAKHDDLLINEKVFDVFYTSLKGRQLLVYSGVMKDYAQKYESGELDDFKEKDENAYTHLLSAIWAKSKYIQELRALTEHELQEINKTKFVEEVEDII